MTFADWLDETARRFRLDPPLVAARSSALAFKAGAMKRLLRGYRDWRTVEPGDQVYERREEWDVLIVMDALRPDALRDVVGGYDYLPDDFGVTRSVADYSRTWQRRNFHPNEWGDEMGSTAHVTWNAFSDYELDAADWLVLDEVWRDGWDDDLGCVPPETVVDRAIAAHAEHPDAPLIVHVMQPHAPYRSIEDVGRLARDQVGEIDAGRETIWDWLRGGKISRAEAWDAYLDNLRWALDDLPRLLATLDDDLDVVLTADHGECFGEYGLYGHPHDVMVPEQVRVPWARVDLSAVASAEASGARDTGGKTSEDGAPGAATERLEQLGYI